jgi:hypothetical protein
MNKTRNEQTKRKAEYDIEYSKRRRLDGTSNTAEARERKKEKNVTCYNQMIVVIVGTLTVIIRKYKK